MAVANLHETLLMYTLRKNQLNLDIMELQSRKQLAVASTADTNSLLAANKAHIRDYFKNLYENDEQLQAQYKSYVEIPEFEEEIQKMTAKLQEELDELSAYETSIDTQISTYDVERKEIDAYMESMKTMLSSNIQEDYKFGLDAG